jgi:hypothetical protein
LVAIIKLNMKNINRRIFTVAFNDFRSQIYNRYVIYIYIYIALFVFFISQPANGYLLVVSPNT